MIYEYIEKFLDIQFDDNIRMLFDQHAKIVHFPAQFTVLHEGDRASSLYFILSGVVRGYYIDELGNDITKCFSMENGICSSEGLLTENAASYTVECLKDCKCIKIPYSLFHEVINSNLQASQKINSLFLKEIGKYERRSRDFVIKNAEERYRNFCKDYPSLHNRIALKYIASYIGIRIPSLSRIRKKMKILTEN